MTRTEICNCALVMLGMNEIISIEEESTSAIRCRKLFPLCRDRMLREHDWAFAIATAELQQLSENSLVELFPLTAAVPNNCARVIRLHSGNPYLIRGNKLLVQQLPDKCDYVQQNVNPELFDPNFSDALASLIASELALHGTRDFNAVNFHMEQYRQKIQTAKALDAIENIHHRQFNKPVNSQFLNSRMTE